MFMKKIIYMLLTLCLMFALAACGQKDDNTSGSTSQEGSAETLADTKEESTINDKNTSDEDELEGNKENETNSENRVVATSVAIVEILDALDVNMVGIPTSSYELPESVKDATEVGNPMSPDIEVIKSLNPSIVLSVVVLEPTLKETFDAANISSEFINLNSYEGLVEGIKLIGEKTNSTNKAEELANSMEDRVKAVEDGAKDKEESTVMIIFGVSGSFQIATEMSYVGDLVKRVGGKNVIEDVEGSFIPVDIEYLADKDPDYILLMTHANVEESLEAFEKEFDENAMWDNFTAIKEDRVIALDSKLFGMSANLFAPEAVEELEEILYDKE